MAVKRSSGKGRKSARKSGQNDGAAKAHGIVDPRFATALAHPLRVHILGAVAQRALSPAQVARECGEPVSKVSYHFNVLRDCDCIELTDEVPKRGAVEHFYRGTKRALLNEADWKLLPKSIQGGATGVTLLDFFKNALAAVEAGSFDAREDRHLTWSMVALDEPAWKELVAMLERTREQVMDLAAEAAARLATTGGEGINATVALAGYEAAEPARRAAKKTGRRPRKSR